jgi:hypothetical protein
MVGHWGTSAVGEQSMVRVQLVEVLVLLAKAAFSSLCIA